MTEPMVPADVELRGLPWMRLDTVRLLDSDLFAKSKGDEFKAAVALWCKSWGQVPAGSLPDDDQILAHLSGAGSKWKKVRAMALRGWVVCSDGRLYHPVVAEQAMLAWSERTEFREKIEGQNARKHREREERAAMFALLKEKGVELAWNTPTGVLREKLRELSQPLPTGHSDQSREQGDSSHGDSHGLDGTGRDGNKSSSSSNITSADNSPTPADDLARALHGAGFPDCSPTYPDLVAAKAEGVTPVAIAAIALKAIGDGKPLAYVIQTARGKQADARKRAAANGEAPAPAPVDPAVRKESEARHRMDDLVFKAQSDCDHQLISPEERDRRISVARSEFDAQFPGRRQPAPQAEARVQA